MSNDLEWFENLVERQKEQKPEPYTQEELYRVMHSEGKRRFGSPCRHEKKINGHCTKCLRKVI